MVIPAAGRGKRFGSPENKIWATLGGLSVLERTLAAFSTHPGIARIVIAAGEDELDRARATAARCAGTCPIDVVPGGETRSSSVRCGLDALGEDIEIVLVHDAARPLVSGALIDRVIAATIRTGAAVPGLPLSDTVKRADAGSLVRATIPRTATIDGQALTGLTAVQTPQGAMLQTLRRAYAEYDFAGAEPTDEASLIEAWGAPVEIAPGDPVNIKITRQDDITLAERLLPANKGTRSTDYTDYTDGGNVATDSPHPCTPLAGDKPSARDEPPPYTSPTHPLTHSPSHIPETRTGFGYDVHAFAAPEAGRRLFLGGIEIEHECGLEGHSDADVLLHAVCDALLGALSLGDIGILFPNTDETYRGISSLRLLETVAERVREAGWLTVNIDATVVAEAPKLMPHRIRMQETIAASVGITPDRVSVKATTSEKLGFVGRREGMAAWAVATVQQRVSDR